MSTLRSRYNSSYKQTRKSTMNYKFNPRTIGTVPKSGELFAQSAINFSTVQVENVH